MLTLTSKYKKFMTIQKDVKNVSSLNKEELKQKKEKPRSSCCPSCRSYSPLLPSRFMRMCSLQRGPLPCNRFFQRHTGQHHHIKCRRRVTSFSDGWIPLRHRVQISQSVLSVQTYLFQSNLCHLLHMRMHCNLRGHVVQFHYQT
jgi:hypothetical protein